MGEPKVTDRQRQVGSLLAEGYSAAEVAELLGIEQGTVEQHRHMLYKLIGVDNIVDLVHYAIAHGWVRVKGAKGRPRKPS